MGDERTVRRDPRLPFQEIDGRTLVVVPERREMHELDETATVLWRELGQGRSVEELVGALCEEYEVDPVRAARDVRAFLDELVRKGLVQEA